MVDLWPSAVPMVHVFDFFPTLWAVPSKESTNMILNSTCCLELKSPQQLRILLAEELQYFGPGTFDNQIDRAYKHFTSFCRSRKIQHSQPPFTRKMVTWRKPIVYHFSGWVFCQSWYLACHFVPWNWHWEILESSLGEKENRWEPYDSEGLQWPCRSDVAHTLLIGCWTTQPWPWNLDPYLRCYDSWPGVRYMGNFLSILDTCFHVKKCNSEVSLSIPWSNYEISLLLCNINHGLINHECSPPESLYNITYFNKCYYPIK